MAAVSKPVGLSAHTWWKNSVTNDFSDVVTGSAEDTALDDDSNNEVVTEYDPTLTAATITPTTMPVV